LRLNYYSYFFCNNSAIELIVNAPQLILNKRCLSHFKYLFSEVINMANNISPLVPLNAPPLVREKRHYPGEHKKQKKQKQDDKSAQKQVVAVEEIEMSDLPVDTDKKDGKVTHIDEYV
jgi:hypothetical protein